VILASHGAMTGNIKLLLLTVLCRTVSRSLFDLPSALFRQLVILQHFPPALHEGMTGLAPLLPSCPVS